MNMKRTGFTLVEIMVASTIGAFISLTAVAALKTVIQSDDALKDNIDTASEVRFASSIIERDLFNLYRDDNIENTRFYGTLEILADYETSVLTFYTLNKTKARAYEPEGDLYEVEYYLEQEDDKSVLVRRIWPNPNDAFDPGGILTTIAENIDTFEIQYYDGEEWYPEWLEDMETLPDMVEVMIASQPERGYPITTTLLVNLTQSVGNTTETE